MESCETDLDSGLSFNLDLGYTTPFIIDESVEILKDSILSAQEIFRKTFTSGARIASKYLWDFGDNTPLLETTLNPITHDFRRPGIYTVKHKACVPAFGCTFEDPACCCSPEWCIQTVQVLPPPAMAGVDILLGLGLLTGFLFLITRRKKRSQIIGKE